MEDIPQSYTLTSICLLKIYLNLGKLNRLKVSRKQLLWNIFKIISIFSQFFLLQHIYALYIMVHDLISNFLTGGIGSKLYSLEKKRSNNFRKIGFLKEYIAFRIQGHWEFLICKIINTKECNRKNNLQK